MEMQIGTIDEVYGEVKKVTSQNHSFTTVEFENNVIKHFEYDTELEMYFEI